MPTERLKNKVAWGRALLIGLVAALSNSTVTLWVSKVPYVGGVISGSPLLATTVTVGLIVMVASALMDYVPQLEE